MRYKVLYHLVLMVTMSTQELTIMNCLSTVMEPITCTGIMMVMVAHTCGPSTLVHRMVCTIGPISEQPMSLILKGLGQHGQRVLVVL